MHHLSPQQLQSYHTDGYLLLPDLIDKPQLDSYEQRFVALASGVAEPTPAMKIMRDIMVVKGAVEPETPLHAVNKMINFEDDQPLYGYPCEPRLVDCVRDLIGEDVYSISTNVFNKPPGVDGRHPMHQDLRYFRIRPADSIIGSTAPQGTAR